MASTSLAIKIESEQFRLLMAKMVRLNLTQTSLSRNTVMESSNLESET